METDKFVWEVTYDLFKAETLSWAILRVRNKQEMPLTTKDLFIQVTLEKWMLMEILQLPEESRNYWSQQAEKMLLLFRSKIKSTCHSQYFHRLLFLVIRESIWQLCFAWNSNHRNCWPMKWLIISRQEVLELRPSSRLFNVKLWERSSKKESMLQTQKPFRELKKLLIFLSFQSNSQFKAENWPQQWNWREK